MTPYSEECGGSWGQAQIMSVLCRSVALAVVPAVARGWMVVCRSGPRLCCWCGEVGAEGQAWSTTSWYWAMTASKPGSRGSAIASAMVNQPAACDSQSRQ